MGIANQVFDVFPYGAAIPQVMMLDLLIVTPETKKTWDDRRTVEWEGGSLKVVTPQGLILLKSLRGTGQDHDDIEYLRSLESED